MRPRPEIVRPRTRPKNFFEAEATMYVRPRPDTLEYN